MDGEKLLPCPFCGGEGEIGEVGNAYPLEEGSWFVACKSCRATSKLIFPVKEDVRGLVIEAWNTRAAPPPSAESGELERAASDERTACLAVLEAHISAICRSPKDEAEQQVLLAALGMLVSATEAVRDRQHLAARAAQSQGKD